jgi:transcription factor TFIIIB component B''
MIDDEANFDILDASEEVQAAAAKFRPKQRAKPRKTILSSRSAASHPTVENGNGKLGVSNQLSSSKELASQERASLTCPGSETIDDAAGSQGILETPSADVLTVPLRAPGGTSAADRISQDDKHDADSSKLAMHKESLVIPDIQVSPASSCGKTIDDIVEFEELFGAQDKEERVAKFRPKVQTKLLKATKYQKNNQKVEASHVNVATQKESGDNIQTRLHYDQLQDPKCHGSMQTADSEGLLATSNSDIDNLANLDSVHEVSVQEETIAKFCPKLQPKHGMVSSKVVGTNNNSTADTLMVGICAENNDLPIKPKDQETITTPATWSPQVSAIF